MSFITSETEQVEGIHILHVDDQQGILDLTATMLQRESTQFEIETVTSVSEGRDRLADTAFDCVISDYNMPGQTGIEFLEIIRKEYSDLPFILYTGKGSEEIASDAISAGVTDYLQKGTGVDHYTLLANRVRNAVKGYRSKQALSELKLKDRAMDTAPVGITISDPSQDDNPLIYVNDRWTEITGYAAEEVLGSNPRFLQGEDTNPESVAQIREAIDERESVTVELRNYRKDGSMFWNRVSIAPVREDDSEVTNYVGFQQDITEQIALDCP